jgi:hypothetical protein
MEFAPANSSSRKPMTLEAPPLVTTAATMV